MFKSKTCLCGVHVQTGARIVAILSLCFHSTSLLYNAFSHYDDPDEEGQVGKTLKSLNGLWIMIILDVSLLLGNLYKKPVFYWPYMIITFCIILVQILFASSVVFFGGFSIFIGDSNRFDDHMNYFLTDELNSGNSTISTTTIRVVTKANLKRKMEMTLILALIATLFVGIIIIQSYLLSIVVRSYSYLKNSIMEKLPSNQLELYEQKY